jgi:transposase
MKIKEIVGIDVSKNTLDACIHTKQLSGVFDNSSKGFARLYSWYSTHTNFSIAQTLFVFEHTGLYSEALADFLTRKEIPYRMVSGLEIKRSMGLARGKSDQKDAVAIARYGFRRRDELQPQTMPDTNIRSIKRLLSLRERLVRQRAGYKASLKEQKRILDARQDKLLLDTQRAVIAYFDKLIADIEKELMQLIKADAKLDNIFELITGIKGVGTQTALFLIAYTDGFEKFDNSRKFASYCGIAPFPNQSGISIRGRTKVSHLANKKIKSLLDMCAKSAILANTEMKLYYEKRVQQGKNKRSTINIIRNKLLSRIFAVVKRGTPYVQIKAYAA